MEKGSVMRLGDEPVEKEIEVIKTGSVTLNRALGVGGFPKGRFIEIYGPESSLEKLLWLSMLLQKLKKWVVLLQLLMLNMLLISFMQKI